MTDPDAVIRAAEEVTGILEARGVDVAAIRDLCRSWRLRGLDPLIEEATER